MLILPTFGRRGSLVGTEEPLRRGAGNPLGGRHGRQGEDGRTVADPERPDVYMYSTTSATIRWCNEASPGVFRKKHLFPERGY